jgi:hypothetical protein
MDPMGYTIVGFVILMGLQCDFNGILAHDLTINNKDLT